MPKQLSRSPEVDTEKCVAMSGGNRFDLVLMAAARSREIKRQNSTSQKFEHLHSIVTALIEFQEGKIGREYIHKIKFNEYDNRVDRRAKYK
jgi:DNA-directed RNA polymerase subunit K/omega